MDCIIYKVLNYKDKDLIIYVYSKAGIKSYILKNGQSLKNEQRHKAQFLNVVKIEVSSLKNLSKVRNINKLYQFSYVPTNYKKIKIAHRMISLIISEYREFDNEQIYNLLLTELKNLETNDFSYLSFFIKISALFGIDIKYFTDYKKYVNNAIYDKILSIYDGIIIDINNEELKKIERFISMYYYDLLGIMLVF